MGSIDVDMDFCLLCILKVSGVFLRVKRRCFLRDTPYAVRLRYTASAMSSLSPEDENPRWGSRIDPL
jgi:hypothetical protein